MNVRDVDLNLLRVFDAVLRERGVTPAAAGLGFTQPPVSKALPRLRGVFGDPLFVRTPAGMDATPFARELAEPVRQALALLEAALAHGPGFDPATATRAFRFYMSDLGQIEFLRSEEHTSELQSRLHLVCRLLLEKKKKKTISHISTSLESREFIHVADIPADLCCRCL